MRIDKPSRRRPRGFIIIFGRRVAMKRNLEIAPYDAICPHCRQRAMMTELVRTVMPTLFFCPIGFRHDTHWAICERCDKLSKSSALARLAPQTCADCNLEQKPGAQFCPQCGHQHQPEIHPQIMSSPPPTKRRNPLAMIGMVVLCTLITLATFVVATRRSSSMSPAPASAFSFDRLRPGAPDVKGFSKSKMIGATTGGAAFALAPHGNEPVIGFRLTMARWDNKSVVRTLEPLYASDNLVETASMIVAKPGYAVGGIWVDADQNIVAMSLVFMRIEDGKLNVNDSYRSDWFGQRTGDALHLLGGDGAPIVGIFGRKGMNLAALGLLSPSNDD